MRLGGRSGHQRLQPLLGVGVAAIVEFIHVQRSLERHQIADDFLAVRFLLVAHQVRHHQAGENAENDDHHHNFQ